MSIWQILVLLAVLVVGASGFFKWKTAMSQDTENPPPMRKLQIVFISLLGVLLLSYLLMQLVKPSAWVFLGLSIVALLYLYYELFQSRGNYSRSEAVSGLATPFAVILAMALAEISNSMFGAILASLFMLFIWLSFNLLSGGLNGNFSILKRFRQKG